MNPDHAIWSDQLFLLLTRLGEIGGGVLIGLLLLWKAPLKYFLMFLLAIGLRQQYISLDQASIVFRPRAACSSVGQ